MANNKAVAKPSFFMIFTVLLQDVYSFGTHCIVTIY